MGKRGPNPTTNPRHPECGRKRENQGRALSRERKRNGLAPKKRPDKADALDIAWRAGAYVEDVLQLDAPPKPYDNKHETEKVVHKDVAYSTAEDYMAVDLWFADAREPKTGPETGRTCSTRLAVIGSARPWWHSEPMCTRGGVKPMETFTMGV
ncbi:hypothetical protein GCM10010430_18770 [Kitasatospora cystarginea]|uniref:Transposase n=1 Tax=Kitasatospora cystarginea TaxID=58350 RepID=A0ABP5QJU8_9ACTN